MILSHYTHADDVIPTTVAQDASPQPRWDKPYGLWVSVDGPDDWPAWASENMPEFLGKRHYRVTLADDASILYLTDAQELREFTVEYQIEVPDLTFAMRIDWARVSEKWQGIIIAPYVWSSRGSMDLFWYYTWDCASGCIWDSNAIESVALLGWTNQP